MGHGTASDTAPPGSADPASEIVGFVRNSHVGDAGDAVPYASERRGLIESLLSRLAGIRGARVETRPDGGVERVHLLADAGVSIPLLKQQIRSALLAAHDLDVDLGRISIVALKRDPFPLEDEGELPARDLRVRLARIAYEQEGFRIVAHVELNWRGTVFHGVSRDADTAGGRVMAAGRAALKALERLVERQTAFRLEALDHVRAFDRSIMVASVRTISDTRRMCLVGCARATENPSHTAVHAVLAAVNRSLARLVAPGDGSANGGSGLAAAGAPSLEGWNSRHSLGGE
jgi:hypothetical protein